MIYPNPDYPDTQPNADIQPLLRRYFSLSDHDNVRKVVAGESGGDHLIDNMTSSARGLSQQMARLWENRALAWFGQLANIFDPDASMYGMAKLLYEGGGYSHWGAVYDYENRRFRDYRGTTAEMWARGPDPAWVVPAFQPSWSSFRLRNPFDRPRRPNLIAKGDRDWGEDHRVSKVQRALGLRPDGIYGSVTESTVELYQGGNGLGVDGIVGKETWTALGLPWFNGEPTLEQRVATLEDRLQRKIMNDRLRRAVDHDRLTRLESLVEG